MGCGVLLLGALRAGVAMLSIVACVIVFLDIWVDVAILLIRIGTRLAQAIDVSSERRIFSWGLSSFLFVQMERRLGSNNCWRG